MKSAWIKLFPQIICEWPDLKVQYVLEMWYNRFFNDGSKNAVEMWPK